MDGKKPQISVLMAVRNGLYAKEAIESILKQTFADFELIAINNGGGQDTNDLLKSFNDPRIKIIENAEDVGLTKALNQGLAIAEGTYLARMDDDDVSMRERFAKQKEYLDTHPNISVLGSGITLIDEKGTLKGIKGASTNPEEIRFRLVFQNQVVHSSVMMRKEVLLQVSGYNEEFRYAQDLELWGRLSAAGYKFSNISDPLLRYRVHDKSVTQQGGQAYEFGVKAIRKNLSRYVEIGDRDFSIFLQAFLDRRIHSFRDIQKMRRLWTSIEEAYLAKETVSPEVLSAIRAFVAAERKACLRSYLKSLTGR